jgi:hypothetical protein
MRQLLAAEDANVALNHAHVVSRFVAPVVSEYFSVNVCDVPVPEAGVTESAVTAAAEPSPAAVHVPRVCQPLFRVAFAAYMKMLFAPANAGLNVSGRFTVSVVVPTFTDVVAKATEHWLF